MTTYRVIGEASIVVNSQEYRPGAVFAAELPPEQLAFLRSIHAIAPVDTTPEAGRDDVPIEEKE